MSDVGFGYFNPLSSASDYNAIHFIASRLIANITTMKIVQVKAVNNNGGVAPIGLLDVQPMINLVDGGGNIMKHGIVNNLPYFRLFGGTNAIIIDPQVGDFGLAVVSDRDISAFKKNKAQSNPGSWRSFDIADGVYIGGIPLNVTPVQYWQFVAGGMNAKDVNNNTIVMDSTGIKINGVLFDRNKNVSTSGEVTAKTNHTVSHHYHGGVATGTGYTDYPVD